MAITKIRGTQIHGLTLEAGHFLLTEGGANDDYADLSSIKLRVADAAQANEVVAYGQLTALDAKVDAMAIGLVPKTAVRLIDTAGITVVTPAAQTLTGAAEVLSIDGTVVALNDRVMLTNQTNHEENGIYELTTVGTVDPAVAWVLTRVADLNGTPAGEIKIGVYAFSTDGVANKNKAYTIASITDDAEAAIAADDFIPGTSHMHFGLFTNVVNPILAEGTGVTITESNGVTTIAVDASAVVGASNDGDGISIDGSGIISVDLEANNGLVFTDNQAAGAQKIAIKATTFFLNNFKVKYGTCAGGTAEAVEITDAALSSYDELCHKVYLNGQLLRLNTDYTIATTSTTKATVTFAASVVTVENDVIRVEGFVDSANVA